MNIYKAHNSNNTLNQLHNLDVYLICVVVLYIMTSSYKEYL